MDAQRKPPAFLFVLIIYAVALLAPGQDAAALERLAPASAADAQLIEGGVIGDARYAGLHIRLRGDALTYWRDPGEAGVAPMFDFASSKNLAEAEALFPQPTRYDEGGAQAFGYKHEVIFPLRLSAKDPNKPIVLELVLDYSVCEKLCYPLHASLSLKLPPRAEASPEVAAALAQVPRQLDAQETAAFATLARASDNKRWLLSLNAPARDVVVESPAGFFVESRRDGENFMLEVTGHPADRTVPRGSLRLTATGDNPVEFSLSLK
ncbi:hypothetical protein GJ654_02575 [Rhodoblastus acidophilus]|uniref:Thiol:disulfide interchange protein DsbD N-terminal domain-containing protein n=1 Tax=Rhodoblastus acidophilus TaxID=1074 RepID=A0A6N8DJ68_RHOAC|nr:protein-disulfide reductase DsbD domain-containing protein [Rhodoblastus acidophilus]MCW2272973.1 DsbC/DsbD-like thiol-disulfide interchange protein [Rhodoblastus acidophilus]MTV29876.1 hypothetical protein [Rhodoblastus acidophilus]